MTPAIEISHLHYRYPDGTQALTDVSFSIAHGECVGLLGPNGSGKSTLLLHLNGILPEKPGASGAVRIGGEAIEARNLAAIRRQVGLLFQDPDDQLFCATVEEDVAFGPNQLGLPAEIVAERVRQSLARVGLADRERRMPQHLSQGEKRRACLAGILACEPSVMVLDEPTSGLDPRGRRELKALLHVLGGTKLIATHDLELVVEQCPRSVILDGGRLVADGPTLELLADEELMLAHGLEQPHILQHLQPEQPFFWKPPGAGLRDR